MTKRKKQKNGTNFLQEGQVRWRIHTCYGSSSAQAANCNEAKSKCATPRCCTKTRLSLLLQNFLAFASKCFLHWNIWPQNRLLREMKCDSLADFMIGRSLQASPSLFPLKNQIWASSMKCLRRTVSVFVQNCHLASPLFFQPTLIILSVICFVDLFAELPQVFLHRLLFFLQQHPVIGELWDSRIGRWTILIENAWDKKSKTQTWSCSSYGSCHQGVTALFNLREARICWLTRSQDFFQDFRKESCHVFFYQPCWYWFTRADYLPEISTRTLSDSDTVWLRHCPTQTLSE